MDYLSVKEVAELKGCSVRYIKKLCKEETIKAEIKPHPQNKQSCYMIPVLTLPEDLQAKYYKQKRTEAGVAPEKIEDTNDKQTTFKYNSKGIKRAFDSFSEKERITIRFWINLLNEWQVKRSKRKDKTEFDKIFVSHQKYINPDINISQDILYRKYAAYKNECYEELIDNRGGWNKGKSKLDDDSLIWQCFLQLYLSESKARVSQCYRSMTAYITLKHPELVDEIPSEACFRRKIKTIPFAVLEYSLKGEKAMHDHCLPHADRLKDKLYANSIWVMDNYTFDVIIKEDSTPEKQRRMYLTTVLDVKSSVLVGFNITDTPDSASTLLALRHAMLRFGIPGYLYFDNGREFTTDDIVGEKKNRKIAKNKIGNIPPTILERLGIGLITALPTNAQAKVVERAHRTIKEQYCRSQDGYCGGNVLERPESLKRRIKNGDIETEKELRESFANYSDYVFNVANYGGTESKYKGMTAIDVWNASIAETSIRMANKDVLDLLLMRNTGFQKVKKEGVCINYHGEKIWYYDAQETWKYIKDEVCVRYDLDDLRTVRIYDRDDRYLFSWKLSDWAITEYVNEGRDELAEVGRKKSGVRKQIVERSKELKGVTMITPKEGLRYCAEANKDKFKIRIPTKIIPMIVNEDVVEEKMAVGAENTRIAIDLTRIMNNATKRKE